MYYYQVPDINETIKRTGKAIIAIGCSFVQAQGALDDELFENYKWDYSGLGKPLGIDIPESEIPDLLKKYPEIMYEYGSLSFVRMEYRNAFVNVLCKKYFEGEYAPINLGLRGCGNRGSIKELYFNNSINWDGIKETIVIYMPSGPERFDFVNDLWPEHFHWKAMWPNEPEKLETGKDLLWAGYNRSVYSQKFAIIEQISNVQELLLWCKYKNAKLIITPGFDRRYDKNFFKGELSVGIERDSNQAIREEKNPGFLFSNLNAKHKALADLWPWDNMFEPEGYKTFADLAMSKEPSITDTTDYFFQFLNKRSPNGWITACAHPGAKAHDYLAKLLQEKILKL